jgi:hypothetical protein
VVVPSAVFIPPWYLFSAFVVVFRSLVATPFNSGCIFLVFGLVLSTIARTPPTHPPHTEFQLQYIFGGLSALHAVCHHLCRQFFH